MKVLPTALANHIATGTTTLGYLLKITRKDSNVYAFTSSDISVTIGGVVYDASQGLEISNIETSSGLNVDNLELTTLDDGTVFTKLDVLSGRWNNADFEISRYNWKSPSDGVDVIMVGTIGEVRIDKGTVVAELRGLQQYLQQPVGAVISKTCRARLGDTLCTVNLTPYTVTGSVTEIVDSSILAGDTQVFIDASRTEPDDYFSEGVLTFTSGLNNGLSQKVKLYESATTKFTLALPMIQAIAVGDTYSVVAGCRKRLAEDCYTKFNNVLNFQGEPHVPGVDKLSS